MSSSSCHCFHCKHSLLLSAAIILCYHFIMMWLSSCLRHIMLRHFIISCSCPHFIVVPLTCPFLSRDVCLVMQRCRTRVQTWIWVWMDSSSFFWRFDQSHLSNCLLNRKLTWIWICDLGSWTFLNSIVPNIQGHLFKMTCSSGAILWIIMMQLSWLCGVLYWFHHSVKVKLSNVELS